ncbi:MAG: ferric reductase-like transmembrane domain-containing protein [Mycobacteriaceae bacterium]
MDHDGRQHFPSDRDTVAGAPRLRLDHQDREGRVMEEALWALGRGSGVVTLVCMTVSVLLGILTRSGRPALGLPRFAVSSVHRNAGLLASVLLIVHITSLFFDPYAQLHFVDMVVPFLGTYRPFWQGLGTVALDLTLAVMVTSLLRRHIGLRTWRVVHWATYAMWPVALAHGLGNGTDSFAPWFLTISGTCAVAVAAALCWRVREDFVEHRSTRTEPVTAPVHAREALR